MTSHRHLYFTFAAFCGLVILCTNYYKESTITDNVADKTRAVIYTLVNIPVTFPPLDTISDYDLKTLVSTCETIHNARDEKLINWTLKKVLIKEVTLCATLGTEIKQNTLAYAKLHDIANQMFVTYESSDYVKERNIKDADKQKQKSVELRKVATNMSDWK